MKFLADAMLGKLTRFLRIFGFDTIYANDLIEYFNLDPVPDEMLIEYAKQNARIIITKDYLLYKNNMENSVLLSGEGVYNYLEQLNKEFGFKFKFNLKNARCSICNSTLEKVEKKSSIKGFVFEETYNNYKEFFQCSNHHCRKIFWKGSHIDDIEYKLNKNFEHNK